MIKLQFWTFLALYAFSYSSWGSKLDLVVDKIQENDVRILDDALKIIPQDFFKDSPVLMRKSRSIQEANHLFPRLIFYSFNDSEKHPSTFLMGLGGADHLNNGNVIEMIEYMADEARYRFRSITFDPQGQARPIVSPENPTKCMACHGNPLRPIWDSYGIWPGAYGEGGFRAFSPKEKVLFDEFINQSQGNVRYKSVHANTGVYERWSGESPLINLGDYIGLTNQHRIATEISKVKEFYKFRYAIIGSLASCNFRELFDDGVWEALNLRANIEHLLKETLMVNKTYFQKNLQEIGAPYIEDYDDTYNYNNDLAGKYVYYFTAVYKTPAKLRFILGKDNPIFEEWKIRKRGEYDDFNFHYGFVNESRTISYFFDSLLTPSESSSLQNLMDSDFNDFCTALSKRSKEAQSIIKE